MKTYELVVPCHFGLEAVLKREIYDLGYEIGRVEDGRITFTGDEEAICRANIFLRTAERVLMRNYFRESKRFHGKIISRKTVSSGLKKHPPSRVNCSVRPIFSRSRKKRWWSG